MAVFLHDTMSREKRPLLMKPGHETFGMYCCGPTVYGPAHIGNFRTFAVQDVLRRTLEIAGLQVKHVRNINAPASRLKKSCRGLKSNFLSFPG